jgi:hypothetical protein
MSVMIGVDPHKGSHTAVGIDMAEQPLGELKVRAILEAGRPPTRVGSAVRGEVLGHRRCRRAGLPPGPAVVGSR